jgi:hypothetical protein
MTPFQKRIMELKAEIKADINEVEAWEEYNKTKMTC